MIMRSLMLMMLLFTHTAWTDEDVSVPIDDSESPNILYVIPWTDIEKKEVSDPKLVIHDLMGEIYEPVIWDEEFSE